MATLREYFETGARALTVHRTWTYRSHSSGNTVEITAKIAYDFEANAKFWYLYIPECRDLSGCLGALFAMRELAACELGPDGDGVRVEIGQCDYSELLSSETLQYTKRVHLYVDCEISSANRASLVKEARDMGYFLSIRDREYARKRSEFEKPLAFICHDSRDKDDLVRELARELISLMCPVWYDEFSLKVGDSLRERIESGLKEASKCIIVLSPNFISNEGWTKAEFNSIFTREMLEKRNVILPVWHNVERKEVYEYSPNLADRVGLPSSLGVKVLAQRLASAVRTAPNAS